jgi:hypothetical protein
MSNNIQLDVKREIKRLARPVASLVALAATALVLTVIAILPDGKIPLLDASLAFTAPNVLFRGALLALALCLTLTGLRTLLIAVLLVKPPQPQSTTDLQALLDLEHRDNLVQTSGLRFVANILGWASGAALCVSAALSVLAIWRIINP